MRYLVVVLLSGCTTQYAHPTKSDAEFQRDVYECERDAAPAARQPIVYERMLDRCLEIKGWARR